MHVASFSESLGVIGHITSTCIIENDKKTARNDQDLTSDAQGNAAPICVPKSLSRHEKRKNEVLSGSD